MATNYEWARRFVTVHPDGEHLQSSALKYIGTHAYWRWNDAVEVGIIIRRNHKRIHIISDGPDLDGWEHLRLSPLYTAGYIPYRDDDTNDQIIVGAPLDGTDHRGQTVDQIIRALTDRFLSTIKEYKVNTDILSRREVRWAIGRVINNFHSWVEHALDGNYPEQSNELCADLLNAIADNPENRAKWRRLAAKKSAVSRASAREQRAGRVAAQRRSEVAIATFREWLTIQSFSTLWKLRLALVERSADTALPECCQQLEECLGWHVGGQYAAQSVAQEIGGRWSSDAGFLYVVPPTQNGALCGLRFITLYYGWENGARQLTRPQILQTIETLSQVPPRFPDSFRLFTRGYQNAYWSIQPSTRVFRLAPQNADYVRHQLLDILLQQQEIAQGAN